MKQRSQPPVSTTKEAAKQDLLVCGRFPQLPICGCTIPCRIALREVQLQQVVEGVFVGPIQAAFKTAELKEAGVTHIVDVSGQPYHKKTDLFSFLSIEVPDQPDADISSHFERTRSFIDEALASGGAVLVHCSAGVSRSATIVIAWLMASQRLTFQEAFVRTKQARNRIDPNPGFLRQLQRFERELNLQKAETTDGFLAPP
ncbi:protein-tyrosine-phosphatase [Balamuthia mandrillaris]